MKEDKGTVSTQSRVRKSDDGKQRGVLGLKEDRSENQAKFEQDLLFT